MRIAVLWMMLVTATGVFVAMLTAMRRHQVQKTTAARGKAGAEAVWTVIPWLIIALGAAPAVHQILVAERVGFKDVSSARQERDGALGRQSTNFGRDGFVTRYVSGKDLLVSNHPPAAN